MVYPGEPSFTVRLAQTPADLNAALRLRYDVFVEEFGAGGAMVDHAARLEQDVYDGFCDHLLLMDTDKRRVAGVYRVMRSDQAAQAGGFYSAGEYDLAPLLQSGRRLLELGRSCLHPDYRGGRGMHVLWQGLAQYISRHDIEVLFGVASFPGTDVDHYAQSLSLLHHRHRAPVDSRVGALQKHRQNIDLVDEAALDRKAAMVNMPSLIKAYLRLGGVIGDGAFVDRIFKTIDVFLMLDTAQLSDRQARKYTGARA
ncbi:MAG: GNAT family N-acyltransferase [Pseudomonadota bacterium]